MMRTATRTKAIAFFITLGVCMLGAAITLNVSWIMFHWREVMPLLLGVIFFGFIIVGLVLNTIYLVREIRRNEQQDSFLNAVTHELKTPLASLRLYLDTLNKRELDETQRREFYRIMLQDTDRLMGMVEQLLKASELRGAKSKEQWQQVDFSAIVREALEIQRLRHNLPPEALHFGAAPPDGITLLGDAEELRTAVANLFDNAVKYSGTKTDIAVDVLTPNIDMVLLRVRDRGVGIPTSELKRIFRRFHRVRNAATRQVKGTGLGLFLVRAIARRHGGDAYAESAGEGCGSTFTLRLPRMYHV